MQHQSLDVDASLRSQIVQLWALAESQAYYNRQAIIPDSYAQLIICCGAPLQWLQPNGTLCELPAAFILGVQQQPLHLYATGACQLVGIQIYAWAVGDLLGQACVPNQPLALQELHWQRFANQVRHWARAADLATLLQHVHEYLIDHVGASKPTLALHHSGLLLYQQLGNLRMSELAQHQKLSLSQFERQFRQITGITPKQLARLIRFEQVRDRLVQQPQQSIAALAVDLGYSDQAHLLHEFRHFAGLTPRQFCQQVNADFLQD
ncbi:helix-turn-helix domain-containing protein [Herpetosiphon llansteffanensis]|uniref:helix-turn-helix domain-containing protein n=1 Tax=Herpetosiphon llansteffanensis TaxID=2094568 RepID=UPI000D7CD1BC|nr:helix-turn-helix domain-containing protein [Herpetosiphon llansteffanensis]